MDDKKQSKGKKWFEMMVKSSKQILLSEEISVICFLFDKEPKYTS